MIAGEDDEWMQGNGSPAWELSPEVRAAITQPGRLEQATQILPRDEVHGALGCIAYFQLKSSDRGMASG